MSPRRIENEYRRAGYILVRAFVPPQRVADGIFTINVVEGFISNVSVEGGKPRTRERIRTYLEPAQASRPLQLSAIERGLLMANDLPGVTAAGVLRPSPDTQGASELVVSVPDNPLSALFSVDNRGSRFSGIWSATADVTINSVLDDEDQVDGSVTGALDASPLRHGVGQLRYRRPVGDQGALLSLVGTITHGEPGSTLQAFDVLTNSWAVGPRFTFPLERTRAESFVLESGFHGAGRAREHSGCTAQPRQLARCRFRRQLCAQRFSGRRMDGQCGYRPGRARSGRERQWRAGIVARRRQGGFHQAFGRCAFQPAAGGIV